MKKYAGIGSRSTPQDILIEMTTTASALFERGWILRSGAADGADTAFESGIPKEQGGEIFIPWASYSDRHGAIVEKPGMNEAAQIASRLHPNWTRLSTPVKLLMTRNVRQILGANLNDPVRFVLCWTPDGCEHHDTRTSATGGTGLAIALASHRNIPVINMKNEGWKDRLKTLREQYEPKIHRAEPDALKLAEKFSAFDTDCEQEFGPSTVRNRYRQ